MNIAAMSIRNPIAADPASTPHGLPVETESPDLHGDTAEGTSDSESSQAKSVEPSSMKDLTMEALDDLEKHFIGSNPPHGLSTGLVGFDAITGGLQSGQLGVIAGRPAMGKTAFVMQTALHVSIGLKKTVVVFSLQSTAQQLTQRLLYSIAGVSAIKIRSRVVDRSDCAQIIRAAEMLADSRMLIDDDSGLSVFELRDRVRHWKTLHDIQLVVVDKMACLESGTRIGSSPHQFSFDEVTWNLKAMARELKIPVLGVAELNRKPDERLGLDRGWPRLKDLRKRKAIAGLADFVAMLVRESFYAENKRERKKCGDRSHLLLFKDVNCRPEILPLFFNQKFCRFQEPLLCE